jgi:PAS domain S-box-containing protein
MRNGAVDYSGAKAALGKDGQFDQWSRAFFDACGHYFDSTIGYLAFLGEKSDDDAARFLDIGGRFFRVDPHPVMPWRNLREQALDLQRAVHQNDFAGLLEWPFADTRQAPLQNALLAPVMVEGKAVGIIGLANKHGGFTDADLDVAMSFAQFAGNALLDSLAYDMSQEHLDTARVMLDAERLKVRQYLDAADALLVGLSLDGKVMVANQAMCSALGTDESDLLGQAWPTAAFPGAWQADIREFLSHSARDGFGACNYIESPFLTPIGMRTVAWRYTVIYDATGSAVGTMCSGADITECKEAEERLHEIRRRLELAVRAGEIGLWDWDPNSEEVYFSPEWKAQPGCRDDELSNRISEWRDRLHPEDEARAVAKLTAFIESPFDTYMDEFRLLHKDGSYRWILSQANAICDSYGLLWRVVGTHVDFTDRMRSSQASEVVQNLHEFARSHSLDELLREIIDQTAGLLESPIGFFGLLAQDEERLCLQAYSTATVERFCTNQDPVNHCDISDTGNWADCVRQQRTVVLNDFAASADGRQMPDGHPDIKRLLIVPVLRAGRVTALLGIGNKPCDYSEEDGNIASRIADLAWEVVERKRSDQALVESEERLRLSLELSPEPIFLHQDGMFTYINQAGLTLLGADREQLLGTPVMERLHPDNRAKARERLKKLDRQGVIAPPLEVRFIRMDGSIVDVEATATMILMPNGPTIEVALKDISQRKLIEREIQEHQRKLTELARDLLRSGERERRRVAIELHDGVGQALAAAKMNTQRLVANPTDCIDTEAAQQLIDALESAIAGIRSITSELSPPLLQAFGLGAALERLAERFLQQYELECDVRVLPRVSRLKNDAATILYRAATELLNNVHRHSGVHSAILEVTMQKEMIVLTVEDKGRGFDSATLDYCGTSHDGFGLCSICEEIQLVHGHTIIDSSQGNGTRVEIRIPASIDWS